MSKKIEAVALMFLLSLPVFACSSSKDPSTGPSGGTESETIAASFTLEKFRGQPLPGVADASQSYQLIINSATLELTTDRRWTEKYTADSVNFASHTTTAIPSNSVGSYVLHNNVFTFNQESDRLGIQGNYTGTLNGTALTYTFEGSDYIWRRK